MNNQTTKKRLLEYLLTSTNPCRHGSSFPGSRVSLILSSNVWIVKLRTWSWKRRKLKSFHILILKFKNIEWRITIQEHKQSSQVFYVKSAYTTGLPGILLSVSFGAPLIRTESTGLQEKQQSSQVYPVLHHGLLGLCSLTCGRSWEEG